MNGNFEAHLQNIRDFVQIDDKIVTYKWISKVLKVHSNTAKQLLYSFIKKPEVKEQLLITYIVAGEPNCGSGLNFCLVRADELEETKKKFSKVTSVHVYSVQKGISVSGADIYNADGAFKLTAEDQKYCSILPAKDIERREVKIRPPSTDPPPTGPTKKEPKEEAVKKTSPKKASPKKSDHKKPADTAKGGGIGALFMRQAAKSKEVTANKAVKEKGDKDNKADDVSDEKVKGNMGTTKEEIKKKPVNGEESVKNTIKTPPVKSKSRSQKKRKKPSDHKDSAAKRRKRIQVASDSESSEESESGGDERYPSPEPELEAPTVIESEEEEIIPATPVESGRKRVRKLVDRTFEDEEGYIITKKEYVFESCSDDESNEPERKKTEFYSQQAASSKTEGKSVNKLPPKQSISVAKKEEGKEKDSKKPEEGNHSEPTTKKKGRPPSKAKPNSSSSPKKQVSITNFFKKK